MRLDTYSLLYSGAVQRRRRPARYALAPGPSLEDRYRGPALISGNAGPGQRQSKGTGVADRWSRSHMARLRAASFDNREAFGPFVLIECVQGDLEAIRFVAESAAWARIESVRTLPGVDAQKCMFPVLFAIGRMPGWLAQWQEGVSDPEQKISRPRQIYVGEGLRHLDGRSAELQAAGRGSPLRLRALPIVNEERSRSAPNVRSRAARTATPNRCTSAHISRRISVASRRPRLVTERSRAADALAAADRRFCAARQIKG